MGIPDRKKSEEELVALKEMGFKKGDRVDYLGLYTIPETNNLCMDGTTGTVVDIVSNGAVAYVKCNSCGNISREEL